MTLSMLAMHWLTARCLRSPCKLLGVKVTVLELFLSWMICKSNLWLWAGSLCMLCLYTIALVFVWPVQSLKTWDCFVDTVFFLMWFRWHGSCVWACLLQLIRIYAKKHFLQYHLESRNLTLVIAFSLYNGDNAFTLSSSLFAWTCFYLPIKASSSKFTIILCCILWEARGENMFTNPLAFG